MLRRSNFGEADRIVTLFTRDRGKISAVAKGSRRIKSSISGSAELCSYSVIQLAAGSNLDVITQMELRSAFLGLRSSLDRISRAMYLLEFCAEFLEDRHPNPDLFFLLLSALYVLEKSSSLDWVVSGFEVQAMAILGYAPQIAACVSCGRPAVGLLRFSAPMGGVVCGVCSARHRESIGVSAQAIEAIGLLGELELAVLGKQEPPPDVETEVRGLLRAHIRSRAEREMRSTRFIDQLRTL